MVTLYFSAISRIAFTILAISERGTVASSKIVVGFSRARADKADRLAVVNASASSFVWAICTDMAPSSSQICAIFSISLATTSSGPSCSMSKTAST